LAQRLRGTAPWKDCIGGWYTQEAREADLCDFPAGVDQRLVDLFAERGLHQLFRHQAEAIEAALSGRDVLVATPTASGKTLCYTVPILQSLLDSGGCARALFLFPTKALSQDQSSSLTSLVEALGEDWHASTYDGDTPPSVRRTLRDRGHMILTNPWMLHAGILPNHAKWSELFRDLRYIVVDEVHTLSGVFGSSVANVLRRLLRIARHYGSEPRFIGCSATLPEPGPHARRLFGRPVQVVEKDGSPSGRRLFAIHNPPLLDPVAGLRANALEEARRLAPLVCGRERQTIFFCNRRTAVDVLTRYLKKEAKQMGLSADQIRGYRGGYLPLLRREIEADLRSGEAKVVVTTNALELGIDIGALDVAVLVGYPGSQASFWQRAGRVGRRGHESLVIQISRSDPVDQFLALHPEYLFGAAKESLALDPDNLVLLSEHVKCAAFELPFERDPAGGVKEQGGFGDAPYTLEILEYLAQESELLLERDGRWHWMADAYPAQDVTLAGNEPDNVVILEMDTERALGEIDREGALTTCHEGAIYLVEGETWKIERLDWENRRALARPVDTDYFTEALTDTEVRVTRLEEHAVRVGDDGAEDFALWCGEVHVTTIATQYKKIRFYTRENLGAEDIHLPPEEKDTEAFILALSDASAEALGLTDGDRGSAWRGVGTIIRRVAPLFVRCQSGDLGISTQVRSPHFNCPALYLYDRVMGGVGLAEILYRKEAEVLAAALEVVSHCPCERGCPACVGPPAEVGGFGKETAARILAHLAGGPRPERREAGDWAGPGSAPES
jgi:DEAD/DEAH box helicase domain-containing protein